MSRFILASVITATLTAAAAAPAIADQRSEVRSIEVDISGIDMTTDAGARMVLKRIERAADQICGVRGGLKSVPELRREKACVTEAIETTINSMGNDPVRQAAIRAVRKS